jgi:hypothetical protein
LSDRTRPAPGAVSKSSSGNPRGRATDGGDPRFAAAVFALLVLACFAALVVTQRLKHTPTLVQEFKMNTSFSPASTGVHKLEAISFKLSKADVVTVTILSAGGEEVATLVHDRPVGRYKKLSLRWDGHEGRPHGYRVRLSPHGYESLLPVLHGPLAPAGEYQVRVALRAQKRTVPSPRVFKLVAP